MKRIRVAANGEALKGIYDAAKESCTGKMIYRKWSREENRMVQREYEVVPLDCGYTSQGNFVLYAQDYRNGNQVKQFVVEQIMSFEKTKRRVKPSFEIQVYRLGNGFGIKEKSNVEKQDI